MTRGRSTRIAAARPARGIRRAYLHHLIKAEEMLGPMLLTWHNVQYYQDLMRGLRERHIRGRRRLGAWPRDARREPPLRARRGDAA